MTKSQSVSLKLLSLAEAMSVQINILENLRDKVDEVIAEMIENQSFEPINIQHETARINHKSTKKN